MYATHGERTYAQALSSQMNLRTIPIKTHTQGMLAAIAPHPVSEKVAVCGRDILKIYSTTNNPQELVNLRMSKNTLNLSYSDIVWGGAQIEHQIVVACNSVFKTYRGCDFGL